MFIFNYKIRAWGKKKRSLTIKIGPYPFQVFNISRLWGYSKILKFMFFIALNLLNSVMILLIVLGVLTWTLEHE